ncbi:MAG TPA: type II secretion system protein GspJ [Fredinandcohnia sp.]|nr:type II secretion system protein GspJ [Fredinandcohnia sp.]
MRARGFTLMELMISIGILAIIAGLVYGSFSPIWQAREEVEAQADRYHAIRLAMERMRRDLSMAFISDRYDYKHFRERPTHFVGENAGDRDRLRFTTFAHVRLYVDAKESDQAIVEYRIDADPEDRSSQALIRRVKPVIDDDPERGGTEMVLVSGVRGLNFEYWDVEKEEWVDEWDTTDVAWANRLPYRVRITLTADGDDGKPRKYVTQARIQLTSPLGR